VADLAAELALRNARFRAWRAYGVPVAGGWEPCYLTKVDLGTMRSLGSEFIGVELRLCCGACGYSRKWNLGRTELEAPCGIRAAVLGREWVSLHASCVHLAPLLEPDPPAVVALTKLELLAGDPPR
jgi:hypothetical protein